MRGGEFCVNLRGLDHYAEHGYKGILSGDPHGGWKRPSNGGDGDGDCGNRLLGGGVHVSDVDRWVTVPYRFNRGIVHDGDLPHLSAPVESILATNGGGGCDDSPPMISRVIIGFNVFGHDVGAIVSTAPEHSRSFRRRVTLYRSAINACRARVGEADEVRGGGGGMDLSQVRKSRVLTKLLVLAKRERVKDELRLAQERLSCGIRRRLLSNHARDLPPLRVADIIEEFGSPNDDSEDGMWPRSVDVHVHVHHMLLPAKDGRDDLSFLDEDGLAGPSGETFRIIQVAVDSGHAAVSNSTNDGKSPSRSLISPSTCLDVSKCK
ncbi:hypothetical protein ACHAXA_007280 [Cyclostephanos tholiformis]|uniref:Uncharacterized protein n=1 Tax=Cyclostephanos tholiformis TaxID=382380 RepID=A0ABD3SGR5_9STRA